MTKIRHHATGQLLEIVNVVLTDNNGTRSEPIALAKGSQVLFLKAPKFDISGIIGYTASYTDEPQFNNPFSMTLTPLTGYQALPWNTKVTMDGEDITSTAYDAATNSINITEVTGDVSIEAEAVEMDAAYQPLEYINTAARKNSNTLVTSYSPNSDTRFEFDINMENYANTSILYFSNSNPNTSVATHHSFFFYTRYGAAYLCFAWDGYRQTPDSIANGLVKINERIKFVCDKGVFTYKNQNNGTYTRTITADPWTVPSGDYLRFFGASTSDSSTNQASIGSIYGAVASENGEVKGRWVPAKRLSDGACGVYDVVKGTWVGGGTWIAPYILTTRTFTNCAATLLSAAKTGTAAKAVIGSTWSIKITPTSGYTFTGGTTPQVEIDGVDVTSQVVTNNGDGTYTVTIVDVPDKPISISAAAIEIPYDAEVEWLQSDGSAYINTGIKASSDIKIDADIEVLSTFTTNACCIFGSRESSTSKALTLQYYRTSTNYTDIWRWAFGNNSQTGSHDGTTGNYHIDSTAAARTMVITGAHNSTISCSSSTFTNNYDIYIFGMNNGGTLGGVAAIDQIHGKQFQFYNGSTLVRDFIPVRDNGIGYLYDKVSGQLFGNAAGSGAFTYGNDVNAVQSNSLLSGSLVSPSDTPDTPDEPNDLDPIDMEDM